MDAVQPLERLIPCANGNVYLKRLEDGSYYLRDGRTGSPFVLRGNAITWTMILKPDGRGHFERTHLAASRVGHKDAAPPRWAVNDLTTLAEQIINAYA